MNPLLFPSNFEGQNIIEKFFFIFEIISAFSYKSEEAKGPPDDMMCLEKFAEENETSFSSGPFYRRTQSLYRVPSKTSVHVERGFVDYLWI